MRLWSTITTTVGRWTAMLLLLLGCVTTSRSQSENVSLVAHLDAYASCQCIWGYSAPDGTELAILGMKFGVAFVDVTEPTNPIEVAYFPHGPATESSIETFGHYAYFAMYGDGAPGLGIVDLSEPLHPTLVRYHTVFDGCWSLRVDPGAGYLWCAPTSDGSTYALNLSVDPEYPLTAGVYDLGIAAGCFSRDDVVYFAEPYDPRFTIWDFGSPPDFSFLSGIPSPDSWPRGCWLTEDGRYLLAGGDYPGGRLRIWDVQDKRHPFHVAEMALQGDESFISQVCVKGTLAYAAWHTAGLQIFDISNPRLPVRVGFYDTYPGTSGFGGAWNVYPYAASGNIYIADVNTGPYIVQFTANYGLVSGTVRHALTAVPLAGVKVTATADGRWATTNSVGQYALQLPPGSAELEYRLFGYGVVTHAVNVDLGETITRDASVQVASPGAVSGVVRSAVDGTPLPGAVVALESTPIVATTDPTGAYHLTGIPATYYVAEVSRLGYGSARVLLDVLTAQNTPRDFALTPSAFVDDAETDLGWSLGVAGDDALTGVWVRADPQGTSFGEPIQPEDDHSPDGVYCFVTGNCPDEIPGCGAGDNDVDAGRTTLLSPVIDLSGQSGATLIYHRWYKNDIQGQRGFDPFQVDISADNGVTWVNLETLKYTHGYWERMSFPIETYVPLTDQIRIRFIAQDLDGGSMLEAAVDDIEIALPPPVAAVESEELQRATALVVSPNPIRDEATLRFVLDRPQAVSIDILDVTGRRVRHLLSRRLQPGEHSVPWDGRDAVGHLVPQGVYLHRLRTHNTEECRKTLVVR